MRIVSNRRSNNPVEIWLSEIMPTMKRASNPWFVYVLQSQQARGGRPGFYYVGSTTDPLRRLEQHNGERRGGGKYTAAHRPWVLCIVHGPYADRGEAFRGEMALKRKRGRCRLEWKASESEHWRPVLAYFGK